MSLCFVTFRFLDTLHGRFVFYTHDSKRSCDIIGNEHARHFLEKTLTNFDNHVCCSEGIFIWRATFSILAMCWEIDALWSIRYSWNFCMRTNLLEAVSARVYCLISFVFQQYLNVLQMTKCFSWEYSIVIQIIHMTFALFIGYAARLLATFYIIHWTQSLYRRQSLLRRSLWRRYSPGISQGGNSFRGIIHMRFTVKLIYWISNHWTNEKSYVDELINYDDFSTCVSRITKILLFWKFHDSYSQTILRIVRMVGSITC